MKHSTRWLPLGIGLAAAVACSMPKDPFEMALARIEQSHQKIGACEAELQDLEMMKCVNDVFAEVGVWWKDSAPDLAALTDVQTHELHTEMQRLDARVRQVAARFVPADSVAATSPETSGEGPESAEGSESQSELEAGAETDADSETVAVEESPEGATTGESAAPAAIDPGAED